MHFNMKHETEFSSNRGEMHVADVIFISLVYSELEYFIVRAMDEIYSNLLRDKEKCRRKNISQKKT